MHEIIKERIAAFNRALHEIPEVKYVGDPILRQKAELVKVKDGTVIGDQLGKVLLHYREVAGIGRGIAATQIGLRKAVFVTFVNDTLQTFINPTVVEKSPETNFVIPLKL